MKYDVVIVNFNGEKIISRCLKSVFASSIKPTKVIIYDNNSADRSVELIEKEFPSVQLIKGEKNIGFGRANNAGISKAISPNILFLNNDVILDKYCAQNLLNEFSCKDVVIINPIIYKGWKKRKNKEVYSFGAEINTSGFAYGLFDTEPNRFDLNCFSGACFMARTKVISKLQFEKRFFLYYEEPDLSAKALREGFSIGRVNSAVCYHLENYSSPKKKADGICFRQFYGIQNRWYMIGKYWPTKLILTALPLNLLHLVYNLLFFIRSGKIKETQLIYLAFASFVAGRRKYYKRPKNIHWINLLAPSKTSQIMSLRKKVYR